MSAPSFMPDSSISLRTSILTGFVSFREIRDSPACCKLNRVKTYFGNQTNCLRYGIPGQTIGSEAHCEGCLFPCPERSLGSIGRRNFDEMTSAEIMIHIFVPVRYHKDESIVSKDL